MTGRLDALKMIFTELKLNQTNYLALIEQALYFVHQEALKPLSKQQSQFDESFYNWRMTSLLRLWKMPNSPPIKRLILK